MKKVKVIVKKLDKNAKLKKKRKKTKFKKDNLQNKSL